MLSPSIQKFCTLAIKFQLDWTGAIFEHYSWKNGQNMMKKISAGVFHGAGRPDKALMGSPKHGIKGKIPVLNFIKA